MALMDVIWHINTFKKDSLRQSKPRIDVNFLQTSGILRQWGCFKLCLHPLAIPLQQHAAPNWGTSSTGCVSAILICEIISKGASGGGLSTATLVNARMPNIELQHD